MHCALLCGTVFCFFSFCLFPSAPCAAAPAPFTGLVIDATTRRPVAGATVLLRETGDVTATDAEGRFLFTRLPAGRVTLAVHHIAYADREQHLDLPLVVPPDGDAPAGGSAEVTIVLVPSLLQAGEVIVRSTGTPSEAASTPFPLAVTTARSLERASGPTVPDALSGTPGVALVRDGVWETAVSIRGLSRANVVTLIDNIRIETAQDIAGALSLVNTHDLERVEVLRSSGSVLSGSGAVGGVVHLITRRPAFSDQPSVGGEAAAGVAGVNSETSQYAAVEASAGRYALRLSGGYRRAGNTMTPEGELPDSRYRDMSLSGTAGLRTFGEQSLYLVYQRAQAEDTGIPGGAPFAPGARARYTMARRELFSGEYTIPGLAPGVPLLSLRASRQEISRNVEIIQRPGLVLTPHAVHTTTTLQAEARVVPMPALVLALGAELWRRDLDSQRERVDQAANRIVGERPIPRAFSLSRGIYGQGEWQPAERLTVAFGARYDRVHLENEETWNPQYVVSGGVMQMPAPGRTLLWSAYSADDGSWSADAGVRYPLTASLDATLLLATAFRSPSLEERYQYLDLGSIVYLGKPDLRPERSLLVNGGLRLHHDDTELTADLFLNSLNDLVTQLPGSFEGRPALRADNVGRARLYGMELSGKQQLASWGLLRLSLSYVRGRDLYAHQDLPQIPPLNGTIEARVRPVTWGTLGAAVRAAARQGDPGPGETATPGYARLDLDLAGDPIETGIAAITFRAGVDNLLNSAYRNHLSTLRGLVRLEAGRNVFLHATVTL